MDEQRQPLTRGRILDAAIAIIDRDGLNGLTMAGLGDSLDVTGMAIYKHFSSKEVLLVAARNALLAGIRTPPAASSATPIRSRLRSGRLAASRPRPVGSTGPRQAATTLSGSRSCSSPTDRRERRFGRATGRLLCRRANWRASARTTTLIA